MHTPSVYESYFLAVWDGRHSVVAFLPLVLRITMRRMLVRSDQGAPPCATPRSLFCPAEVPMLGYVTYLTIRWYAVLRRRSARHFLLFVWDCGDTPAGSADVHASLLFITSVLHVAVERSCLQNLRVARVSIQNLLESRMKSTQ